MSLCKAWQGPHMMDHGVSVTLLFYFDLHKMSKLDFWLNIEAIRVLQKL